MDSTTNHILLQFTMARRLLINSPFDHPTPPSAASSPPPAAVESAVDSKFDANVVLILSVLLCALICSLGLNSIIRCALRCSHLVPAAGQISDGSGAAVTARLANTGIKKKALRTFPTVVFSEGKNLDAECVICLSEFAVGDRVKILPKCNHGFHVRCIDKWLGAHSSCPTCRHCLIETCRKIVDDGSAAITPAPEIVAPVIFSSSSFVGSEESASSAPSQVVVLAAAAVVPEGAVAISMPALEAEGPVRERRVLKSVFFWRKN